MRISDWSSDVCSSDLVGGDHHLPPSAGVAPAFRAAGMAPPRASMIRCSSSATSQQTISVQASWEAKCAPRSCWETPNTSPAHRPAASPFQRHRSEEHTSELQSLMRISYAVFCLKKKNKYIQ